MDPYRESSSGRSTPNFRTQSGSYSTKFNTADHYGGGGPSSGRSSPNLRIQSSTYNKFNTTDHYGGGGGGPSSGRSSPNLRIQSGAYNPTPVVSINAMPYPFSSMKTPQRLLIPTSTVLDSTRPHVLRTPRSTQAVNFDLDAVSDDDDSTYIPAGYKLPPSRKVCNYIDDIINSPEMDQVEEETKKIRRDAEAVLKRLHTPRVSGTREFNTYDYSNIYRIPPPVPATAHNYATAEDYDDEERFSPLRTRPRRPLSQYLYSKDRISPDHILNTRIQIESTRKALYNDPGTTTSSLTKSLSFTSGSGSGTSHHRRTPSYYPDVDTVKNNIAARARYASTRAAAEAGIRKKNEYLMI